MLPSNHYNRDMSHFLCVRSSFVDGCFELIVAPLLKWIARDICEVVRVHPSDSCDALVLAVLFSVLLEAGSYSHFTGGTTTALALVI